MKLSITGLLVSGLSCLAATLCAPPIGAQEIGVRVEDVSTDLIEHWWRWRVALPELATPDKDPLGRYCDTGQTAGMWFLAGHLSFGSPSQPVRRQCIVPANTRLFFPVATQVKFVHGTVTCEQAKMQVASAIDGLTDVVVTIDDVRLPDRAPRRARTDACFALDLSPGSKTPAAAAAADGLWISLDPLPVGKHVLTYGARFGVPKPSSQSVSYLIEIR